MNNPLIKLYNFTVISGGQTGVDLAGLRVAQSYGLKTGGLAPTGFKTVIGPKTEMKTTFGLKESFGGYSVRTRQNIENSNMTLVIATNMESSGTRLTITASKVSEKPYFCLQIPPAENGNIQLDGNKIEEAFQFIKSRLTDNFVLNIAGNSSKSSPGIFIPAFIICAEIFGKLSLSTDQIVESELVERYQRFRQDIQMAQALNDNYSYITDLDPRGLRGLIV